MYTMVSDPHRRLDGTAPRYNAGNNHRPRVAVFMLKHPSLSTILIGLLSLPSAAFAHHSGLYDNTRIVEITGVVTAVAWVNPHVRLTLEMQTAAGETETWQLEGTSVNALERWGIQRDLFNAGDRIIARGPASRFGRLAMIAATVELPRGDLVVLWPNVASRLGLADTGVPGLFPAPERDDAIDATGIFRVWTPRGRSPAPALPLTEPAVEAARRYEPLDDDPALRCEPPGMPVMLDTPYPVQFIEGDAQITMRFEEWDGVRTIYMEPGNGPPVEEPSAKGVSFGRWEGETLAILTTNISYPYFDDLGTPQSAAVMILERYTHMADADRLEWEVTITDPETFTESVFKSGYMTWEPGEIIKPFNCTLLD